MPLGSLQKGSFDITGAVVDIVAAAVAPHHSPVSPTSSTPSTPSTPGTPGALSYVTLNGHRNAAPEWLLRIKITSQLQPIELAVQTKEDALEWSNIIRFANFYSLFGQSKFGQHLRQFGQFQSSFRAVSEQFQSSFRRVSEQFQSSFRTVSEQFQSSFR